MKAYSITIKYYEPGHSFMPEDSVHGNIGTAIRAQPNIDIYDMRDYISVNAHCRNGLEIMEHNQ